MDEIISLILEKVKSEALTVDEGTILIKAFMEQSQGGKGKAKGETKWEHFEGTFETQAKKFMSDLLDEQNFNDFIELGDQFQQNIKKTLQDWLDRGNT